MLNFVFSTCTFYEIWLKYDVFEKKNSRQHVAISTIIFTIDISGFLLS